MWYNYFAFNCTVRLVRMVAALFCCRRTERFFYLCHVAVIDDGNLGQGLPELFNDMLDMPDGGSAVGDLAALRALETGDVFNYNDAVA